MRRLERAMRSPHFIAASAPTPVADNPGLCMDMREALVSFRGSS
jgi:hypothetical protein